MIFSHLKIGARLGIAFGAVLLLMAILIGIGLQRLSSIGSLTGVLLDKDWVKAEAAATVSSTTRANSALTLELFTTTDKMRIAEINREIDADKKTISTALETLDKLLYTENGKALLARVIEQRKAYVASFSRIVKMLDAG